ncbi:putative diguanylate cyclase YdaM [mine drainage metagenome]|uniref:Putative diguanylate cyclase YdaM n=1 Tax=mine drainage metagenome TaxID=410659 RepID=A0A1J5Q8V3_9ZZZZ
MSVTGAGGGLCYQAIYQQDRPCLDCHAAGLVDAGGQPNGKVMRSERFNEAKDAWCQLQEGAITLPDGRCALFSIASDIGALKDAQNRLSEAHAELALKNQLLESLSVTDRLTGLFNRRKLDELLANECERAARTDATLSLMMVDIDHFKNVNDTFGHPVGDQILVSMAELLRHGVRKVDTVARWGGEEFMILCPATPLAGACAVAENIRASIEATDFPLVGHKTVCFGVAQYHPDETCQSLVERADAALYRAKNEGRNCVRLG